MAKPDRDKFQLPTMGKIKSNKAWYYAEHQKHGLNKTEEPSLLT